MSNAQIKLVRKLAQKKFRNELKLFVAEGLRLCEEVPPAQIKFGFYTRDFLLEERARILVERIKKFAPLEEISPLTPQGILLIVQQNFSTLAEVVAKKIIVALDGVQDPGNVGTILRTAAAFDCGVILLGGSAELFNPKVIRSSMGAIFYLPVVAMSQEEFLQEMQSHNAEILAAAVDSSAEIYFRHDFAQNPVAIVFGSEALGVSKKILDATRKIFIPMCGHAESLNVATSAAIIISEVIRQSSL